MPKLRSHQYLKAAASVYINRQGSVLDFRTKIAKILNDGTNERRTIKELMDISRIWKLDTCENVFEVEKYYECETRESLPL